MAEWGPGSGREQTGVELSLEWRVQCPGDGCLGNRQGGRPRDGGWRKRGVESGARMGSKQKATLETKS